MNSPILPNRYRFLTANEIKPKGWLRQQLLLQARGLAGNLDKIWPDVRDSKWVGGDREGWERVPYWLDGFLPLAYLLEDSGLIGRGKRYIDAILANRQEDGWLCPCTKEERPTYDMWAHVLIVKVLQVYRECSGNPRVAPVIRQALKLYLKHLQDFPKPQKWAFSRQFEILPAVYSCYEEEPEEWLLMLVAELKKQNLSYETLFDEFPYTEKQTGNWRIESHVVNLAMALKCAVLYARASGDEKELEKAEAFAEKMLATLQKYHGMPTGHFTGDENLAGDNANQGTELCGVVEAMYSDSLLFAACGAPVWIDRLERLAYNALPAAVSFDMWTHQYDQQTNQVGCVKEPQPIWTTNNTEANLFGMEPHFGCCTSNFGQGWPKFALSTFFREDDLILSAALAPAEVKTQIGGVPVRVELVTDYPFGDRLTYLVECENPVEFTLALRIPGFAGKAYVDGNEVKKGTVFELKREWRGQSRVEVRFDFDVELVPRPHDLCCVRRGPLLFALPVASRRVMHEYVRDGVERNFPYCDYEFFPVSKWNYAFASKEFEPVAKPFHEDRPFDPENPGIELCGSFAEIDWPLEPGFTATAAAAPRGRKPLALAETKTMIPYGCTTLRMTEMPLVEK